MLHSMFAIHFAGGVERQLNIKISSPHLFLGKIRAKRQKCGNQLYLHDDLSSLHAQIEP
jgi:hypothetical protein